MRMLFTLLVAVLLTASVFAQSPEKMSYQAVIRDASDNLVTSQAVGMQISILQGSASGTAVYVETQSPTSNANGLVSLEIGSGTPVTGTFTTIDWANGPYFIKTETDPAGGTSYSITGTSQLLSVPYALHAKTAESITGTITETDPVFAAWDKSTGISITESQISDLGAYIETETDPAVAANFDFTDAANGDLLQFDGTKWVKVTPDYISDYTVTETDVTAHQAALSVTESQITDLGNYIETETQNLSDVLTLSNDANATQIKNLADPTDAQDAATKKYVDDNAGGSTTYSVGDFAQGGIIFWLDATGQHGLIAATADQSAGIQWYNGSYTTTNAVRDGIGAGMYNTERIISNQGVGNYAAQLCANYKGGGYGDWYLPSKYELNLLYLQKTAVGGFASEYYWSSTETSNYNAWGQAFFDGYQFGYIKDYADRVRAVRAF